MKTLRPYQVDAKRAVYAHFRAGVRTVMMQLATGGGKSVVLSHIVRDAVEKNRKVLMLVHRKELVEQLHKHMYDHDLYAGIIMADQPYRPSAPVQIASVPTLVRRLDKINTNFELVVCDESHHILANSYRTIIDNYKEAKLLGVTATPVRTNGQGFSDVFEQMVTGPSIKELVALGALVPARIFASPLRFDLNTIKVTAGDYNEKALYDEMNKAQITGNVVEAYKKHALGKRACVFCINIEHSRQIAEAYKAAGITAEFISGSMPKAERESKLRAFASGAVQVITNCDIITEGFDVPEIECVQLVRPTKSLVKYLQCVGRGLRLAPGKTHAIILDHADCVYRLGFPDDDRQWSLEGIKPKPKTSELAYRDAEGREYKPHEIPDTVEDVELVEIDATDFRKKQLESLIEASRSVDPPNMAWGWRKFLSAVKIPTKEEIELFQKESGYKKGWAYIQKVQYGYLQKTPDFEKYMGSKQHEHRA